MLLGRVVGCVWSTVKNADLTGHRLLLVQPLTPELQATGKRIIATDWTGAGAGEIVYYCRGKECSFPFLPAEVPTDSTIVGIVDSIRVNRAARTEVATSALPPAAPARQVRGRNSRKS
jgi:ethanolamine utilization protein EutN